MKLQKKTEGAISVFLVIILVPCLFITSLFVDVGRVYLSKGMAYSSADLALNSVLTNYDADLNEWYGLIASCQNVNDFYDISEAYFLRTLSSQNLTEDEIKLLTDTFETVVGETIEAYGGEGNEVHDLLKTESVGDVTIEPVDGANLSNSALLKEQMVEFMKYRGPITMVSSFAGMFKKENGDYTEEVSYILDAESDEKIVEAKREFHDAESDLLGSAYKSYSYLYNNYSKQPVENSYLIGKIDYLGETMDIYEEIHNIMVSNLYNTGGLTKFNRVTVLYPTLYYQTFYTYATEGIYSRKEVDEKTKTTTYYVDNATIEERKKDLTEAVIDFRTAIDEFVDATDDVSYNDTTTHKIQYWYQVMKIISQKKLNTKIADKADDMLVAYAKLLATLDCEPDVDVPANYKEGCNSVFGSFGASHTLYLRGDSSSSTDKYLQIVNRLETISTDYADDIVYTNILLSTGNGLDVELKERSDTLYETRKTCQNYVDVLTNVIEGNDELEIVSLDSLMAKAEEYKTAFRTYSNTVTSSPKSALQEEMLEDIKEYKESEYDEVSAEAVKQMKDRLSNIRSQYQSVIDAIDSMKYGGFQMASISDYYTFKTCASGYVDKNSIGLTKEEVKNYAFNTFSRLIAPKLSSGTNIVGFNEDADYNLFLKPEENEVNMPSLYNFFYEQFGPPDDDAVEEQQEQMEEAETAAEENNSGTFIPQLLNADAKPVSPVLSKGYTLDFGMDVGIGTLISIIEDISSEDYTEFRDKAYVSAYILEMFSCATYEKEGLYNLYASETGNDVKILTGTNCQLYYESYKGAEDGKWGSTSTVDTYNKSLTNQLISAQNNGAYLCELEYLLYGNTSNAKNITSACADIFTIRLLLNTISGFINFWSIKPNVPMTNVIDSIAYTAFLASCGVVPAAAVKAVLIMVLVAAETCNDMERLVCGFPVELYKINDKDWQFAVLNGEENGISSFVNKIKNGTFVVNTGEGFTYSDYINLFICMMVWDNNTSETIVLRTGDLIQLNMQQVTGNASYQLSDAHTHFELNAKLRVDPLLVDIPFFNEYNEELKDSTGWLEYNVSTIRGY